MRRWSAIIANVLLFDALWTLAVLGAGKPWWWVAPGLVLLSAAFQIRLSTAPTREAALIVSGALGGVCFDVGARWLGFFRYASDSTPEFLVVFLAMWINFGTIVRPGLRWLWRRPVIAAALGAVSGPLAYWVAARLGAITPTPPEWRALAWCSAQYALTLPLWLTAASRLLGDARSPARPETPISSPPPRGTPRS